MSLFILLMELGILALLRMTGAEEIPDYFAAILILLYSAIYVATLARKWHCWKYTSAITAGFIFRIVLLFFDLYGSDIYTLPNSGADTAMFFQNAVVVAMGGTTMRGAFPEVMGKFFHIFGISRLFGQFMLVMCSMVSIECMARIFELIDLDIRKSSAAMWLVNLLPNFAIMSSIFLRESIITMFITLSMLEYVKWFKRDSEFSFILAILLSFGAVRFHSGTIAVPVGYLLSRILYDNKGKRIRITPSNLIITFLLLLVGVYALNRYGDVFLGKFSKLDALEDIANTNDTAGSSYVRYVGNSNNPVNMLIFTIPRMVFFLFSPMPWMIRGVSDIIAFLFSSCFYIAAMYQTLRYLRSGRTENRELVIVIFIICLCAAFVFGWGVSNSGTACRHRDKMTIIWGVLYGLTVLPKYERYSFISEEFDN